MNRLETVLKLVESQPKDLFLNYAVAMEYLSLSDFDSAIVWLNKLKNIDPTYLPLYYQLAKAYEAVFNEKLAVSTYEEGIELALSQKEIKTASELRSALEELTF